MFNDDAEYTRKLALRPTLAAIAERLINEGYDARNQFAARKVLSARDLNYWQEFIANALPSDWLIWATEPMSETARGHLMHYYAEGLQSCGA